MGHSLAMWINPIFFFLFFYQFNFTLTPDAQIWPRKLNNVIGGVYSKIYLIVGEIGEENPIFDIIIGMAALERFYCVFDSGNKRVGLAETTLTYAKINNIE